MKPEILLKQLNHNLLELLGESLVGIYLHGSYAMNSYHPITSDIDLLVVVRETLNKQTKRAIIDKLIELSYFGPKKGFEVSVITASVAKALKHPLYFELHFSYFHLERYLSDKNYLCENGYDPDLIAHVMVTKARGIRLYGEAIQKIFGAVKPHDFIDAILYDLNDLKLDSEANMTYYVLNLLRFYYYLKDGGIYSKVEGGSKALEAYDPSYGRIIKACLSSYDPKLKSEDLISHDDLVAFINLLITQINSKLLAISPELKPLRKLN
ncbi:MAG: hypothetical protein BGO41_15030 [Clostridiales bacterium 38-18]|nr:MAG: hypothetical protein BGO41_15030 [Clostridiales bacterium 38-18]